MWHSLCTDCFMTGYCGDCYIVCVCVFSSVSNVWIMGRSRSTRSNCREVSVNAAGSFLPHHRETYVESRKKNMPNIKKQKLLEIISCHVADSLKIKTFFFLLRFPNMVSLWEKLIVFSRTQFKWLCVLHLTPGSFSSPLLLTWIKKTGVSIDISKATPVTENEWMTSFLGGVELF